MRWSGDARGTGARHVLRLCSVFEPEAAALDGRAARFDPIGGMQNHTASLSRCLDEQGIRQTVLTAMLSGRRGVTRLGQRSEVRRLGLPVAHLRQLWALCALPRLLMTRSVSLVHAHQGEDVATLLLAMLACARHRCPLVVTIHCSIRHTVTGRSLHARLLRLVGGAVERVALRRAAAVVVLVPHAAELLHRDGLPDDRVHVLPSGFDPTLFGRAHDDAFPGVPHPRVGYVGRLAEQKRPDLLVEAFGRMKHEAQLVVVGDGPLRHTVERAVRRSPAADRITVTGFVAHTEVPRVLASLDLLALPSVYEEMGSVLTEAMASGLPVVASEVGGIPDVVQHGVTGLLVPPLDVDALAAALDELVGDPDRWQAMCEQTRQQAQRYCWPDLARRTADVYDAVTARPR